jgi:hypothetical protein
MSRRGGSATPRVRRRARHPRSLSCCRFRRPISHRRSRGGVSARRVEALRPRCGSPIVGPPQRKRETSVRAVRCSSRAGAGRSSRAGTVTACSAASASPSESSTANAGGRRCQVRRPCRRSWRAGSGMTLSVTSCSLNSLIHPTGVFRPIARFHSPLIGRYDIGDSTQGSCRLERLHGRQHEPVLHPPGCRISGRCRTWGRISRQASWAAWRDE